MRNLTIPLTLTLIVIVFASCQDEVVSPEVSARVDNSPALAGETLQSHAAHELSSATRQEFAQLRRATA